jgi:glycosyltransferase involved in cell wall biosynthesis
MMLHDVIPLDTPEYVSPELTRLHTRMVNSVARYGAGLIVSSAYARQTVHAALAAAGRQAIPTLAARLPLAEAFDSPAEFLPALADVRYFVLCGAIEPRKNHQLVLNIWRQLCVELPDPPHLVFVGSPGWRSDMVLHMLEHAGPMRGRVHHLNGLSTPALKSLLAGASGLLSPTFAEGFGLPIIEAEHLGVPIVASNIAAHREVAGPGAILLDPTDGPAWRGAVMALTQKGARRPRGRPPATAICEREAYTAAIAEFLDAIAAGRDRDDAESANGPELTKPKSHEVEGPRPDGRSRVC